MAVRVGCLILMVPKKRTRKECGQKKVFGIKSHMPNQTFLYGINLMRATDDKIWNIRK